MGVPTRRGGENWRHHGRDGSPCTGPAAQRPRPAPALDVASHAARRRPAARAAVGAADPARARDEPGGAHGRGRRPGPPRRGHRGRRSPCALCGGRRLQALLHPYDQRRKRRAGTTTSSAARAAASCTATRASAPSGSASSTPPGSTRSSWAASTRDKRIRRYEVTMAPFGALFESGDGPAPARLRLRQRPVPRPRPQARLRVLRRRPGRRRDRGGAPEAERRARLPRRPARDPGDRGRRLRRHHDVVGPGPSRRAGRGPDHAARACWPRTASCSSSPSTPARSSSSASSRRWGGFTPNHLLFSSPQTLPLLLRRAGFGAVVMPPWYGEPVERGTSRLARGSSGALRRTIDRGNRGNMLRAAAFADPDGPARWGLEGMRL